MMDQSKSYVVLDPFLSMNCHPNFILLEIPEETMANSSRQNTHKIKWISGQYRETNFFSLPGSYSS